MASPNQFIEIKEYLMKENQDVIAKLELLKLEDHKNKLHIKDLVFYIVSKKIWWIMFGLGWRVQILIFFCPRSWSNGTTMQQNCHFMTLTWPLFWKMIQPRKLSSFMIFFSLLYIIPWFLMTLLTCWKRQSHYTMTHDSSFILIFHHRLTSPIL